MSTDTTTTTATTGASPGGRRPVMANLADVTAFTSSPGWAWLFALLLWRTAWLFAADAVVFGVMRLVDPATTWGSALLWANVSIVVVDVLTIVVVAYSLRRVGSSLRTLLRTRSVGKDIAWGLLLGLIVIVAFFAGNFVANLITYQGVPPIPEGGSIAVPMWFGLWCLIVMPVTIAVAEEVLYRGYLQHVLSERLGRLVGLLIMSVAFGIQHLALTAPDPQAWLARFLTTFFAGLVFGLLAWWMKRLWPLIVAHWLLDVLFLGLPLMMAAVGSA
ncbi:CPBP family intramembrane glutamic endopeptidase [Propionibacteriaceae bacterium Y2011]